MIDLSHIPDDSKWSLDQFCANVTDGQRRVIEAEVSAWPQWRRELVLAAFPDADLFREAKSRPLARSWAAQIIASAGAGRKKKSVPCPKCGATMGVMELRAHKPQCGKTAPEVDAK